MRLYNKYTHEYAILIANIGAAFKVQYERDGLIATAPAYYFETVDQLEDAE